MPEKGSLGDLRTVGASVAVLVVVVGGLRFAPGEMPGPVDALIGIDKGGGSEAAMEVGRLEEEAMLIEVMLRNQYLLQQAAKDKSDSQEQL